MTARVCSFDAYMTFAVSVYWVRFSLARVELRACPHFHNRKWQRNVGHAARDNSSVNGTEIVYN
jgi:hypothetical protein